MNAIVSGRESCRVSRVRRSQRQNIVNGICTFMSLYSLEYEECVDVNIWKSNDIS
jgi:hypothetical protein